MPRKPIGDKAMSPAERQRRHRLRLAGGEPVVRYRNPADHRSRAERWRDAVRTLIELQAEYQDWLNGLPENLRQSATGQALEAIVRVDLSDLQRVHPPKGYGRD